MGGGGGGAKKETNAERSARILSAKKSQGDTRALRLQGEYQRRAKKRPALFGGPETGTLGGGGGTLGVN